MLSTLYRSKQQAARVCKPYFVTARLVHYAYCALRLDSLSLKNSPLPGEVALYFSKLRIQFSSAVVSGIRGFDRHRANACVHNRARPSRAFGDKTDSATGVMLARACACIDPASRVERNIAERLERGSIERNRRARYGSLWRTAPAIRLASHGVSAGGSCRSVRPAFQWIRVSRKLAAHKARPISTSASIERAVPAVLFRLLGLFDRFAQRDRCPRQCRRRPHRFRLNELPVR